MYITDHNQWKYRAHGRVGHGKKTIANGTQQLASTNRGDCTIA